MKAKCEIKISLKVVGILLTILRKASLQKFASKVEVEALVCLAPLSSSTSCRKTETGQSS